MSGQDVPHIFHTGSQNIDAIRLNLSALAPVCLVKRIKIYLSQRITDYISDSFCLFPVMLLHFFDKSGKRDMQELFIIHMCPETVTTPQRMGIGKPVRHIMRQLTDSVPAIP